MGQAQPPRDHAEFAAQCFGENCPPTLRISKQRKRRLIPHADNGPFLSDEEACQWEAALVHWYHP